MIWHFGHMEQFALICWFGWPCSAIIAMFLNNDIPFPLGGPLSPTQGPGYKYSEVEFTSTSTGHMNTGTHTHTKLWQENASVILVLKTKKKKKKEKSPTHLCCFVTTLQETNASV